MEFLSWIRGLFWFDYFPLLAIGLVVLYFLNKEKFTRLPPGPYAMPIIGNIPQLGKRPHLALQQMNKRYGDVFRIYFGSQLVVVVCGKRFVDEVLSVRSTKFSGRPDFFSAQFVLQGKSFAFGNMDVATHKLYKSVAMTAIRKTEKSFEKSKVNGFKTDSNRHGESDNFARRSDEGLQKLFAQEVVTLGRKLVHLGKKYEQKYGEKTGLNKQYRDAVYKASLRTAANMMCSTTFGKRYKPEDQQLDFITDILWDLHGMDEKITLVNWVPILQKLWKRPINTFIGLNKAFEGLLEMHVAMRKRLRPDNGERLTAKDTQNENDISTSNNITDNLLDMECNKEFDGKWNDSMTTSVVGDIFGAGVDTMAVMTMWIIIYFSTFPEVVKKVQAEVNKFVDKNRRLPLYSDNNDLPMVMAFITETLRHCSVLPFTLPHSPTHNTTLGDYFIPQGVVVMVSMWSVNHDPKIWKDHEKFWVGRFLNEDQTFNKALADKVMIYGAGRRRCAGVMLSKIQLFAIVSTLLHTFKFKAFDENNSMLPEAKLGLSLTPLWINVKVTEHDD